MIAPFCFWFFLMCIIGRDLAELFIQPTVVNKRPENAVGQISLLLLSFGHWTSSTAILVYLYIDGVCREPGMGIGLMLLLAGFCGRVAGISKLGASYHRLITRPAGGLINDGVYSIVRHPVYFFYCVEMSGFLAIRPNPVSLFSMILVVAASLWRIRAEDALLAKEYGPAFEEFRQKTKGFIPFVW